MKFTRAIGLMIPVMAVAAPAVMTAANAVELASHRAVYELTLAKAQPSSGLVNVDGGLVLEWREACGGSISTQRLRFRAVLDQGPSFVYDVSFSSWENDASTELRFNMSSYDNGQLVEKYQGEASLDERDNRGVATFDDPAGTVQELPEGTLFPTQHIRELIEAAADGELVSTHYVFDGSGLDALASVTAVIGKAEADENGDERWPMSLAYFTQGGGDELPAFEISFMLAGDGVLHDVVLDYGDFVLNGDAIEIERLPSPTCN
jgi:hypothetical protein